MTGATIPPEAVRFIQRHVRSVAELDLLLLLRTDPQKEWTAEQLCRELRLDQSWCEATLSRQVSESLLQRTSDRQALYQYRPVADLDQAITAVAQAYLLHRVRVIELIYSRPKDNIRAIADAFRFAKEDPDA
jgi:hypothetical protein